MTQHAYNLLLRLCIHQLQKTMQQTHIVITYTYDHQNCSVGSQNRTYTYVYTLISLHATRSLPYASLTYNYDALRPPAATPTRNAINPNNTSSNTPSSYTRSPDQLPQNTTYDDTCDNHNTHTTPYAKTDLYYYGYRYYSPDLGRFVNRDPIGEEGGLNLLAMLKNDTINLWDYLGNGDNDVPPCVSCDIRPFPPPWDTDPIPDVGSLDPLPTKPMVTTYGPESCPDCEKQVIDYRRAFEFRPPLGWICTERGCDYNPPGNSGVIGWDRWHLIQVIVRYICVDEDATGILFDFQQRVGGLGPSGNFRETLWIYLWQ